MICDRDREIEAFEPQEYWTLSARFSEEKQGQKFEAKLEKINRKKAELKDKAHDFELKDTKKVYVFLGASEGVGSNSCGPALAEKYHIEKEGEFAFDFKLL